MNNYRDFVVKRSIQLFPVLAGLSVLIFSIARIMPGRPARLALGPEASQAQVRELRREMGLNDPLWKQYIDWLHGLVTGQWGQSLITHQNVLRDVQRVFPATLELALVALLLAIVLGIPLGVVSAVHKDQGPDHLSRLFALSGVSSPRFMTGILLQLTIGYWLSLLPLSGRIGNVPMPQYYTGLLLVDSLLSLNFAAFKSALLHIILPAITLALGSLAQIARLTRSNMIDVKSKDFIQTMRSNGLPENLLVYKYMLKNAFSVTLTIIGLEFGFMLGGSFVVEIIFGWPGMGQYGVKAILRKDFNAIIAVTLIIGLGYMLSNFIVDLLYGYLDPRIIQGDQA